MQRTRGKQIDLVKITGCNQKISEFVAQDTLKTWRTDVNQLRWQLIADRNE